MKPRTTWLALVLLLVTAASASAQALPSAKPEQVGLSSERLDRLVATLRTDAEKGEIPGAVLLIARHGRLALFQAVGMRDPQARTATIRRRTCSSST